MALDEAALWAVSNKADFGTNKTKLLLFSRSHSPAPSIDLSHSSFGALEQVSEHKILGVIFDSKLTFRSHLHEICCKIKECLFSFRSLALSNFGVKSSTFATIFLGAIIPKLLYAILTWYSILNWAGPRNQLQSTLRIAASMVARVSPYTSNELIFHVAGTLPPDLLTEKIVVQKSLSIMQNSFISDDEMKELCTPLS